MDQNNFNAQNLNAAETREPLPTFGTQPQANFGGQAPTETREPLPTFGAQPNFTNQGASAANREPLPQMNFTAPPPVFTKTEEQPKSKKTNAKVAASADAAFSKGLTAIILAWFPICSIIAIFLGKASLKLVDETNKLAEQHGVEAGGKNTTAKILGLIGLIVGVVNTVSYSISAIGIAFILLIDFLYILAAFAMSMQY